MQSPETQYQVEIQQETVILQGKMKVRMKLDMMLMVIPLVVLEEGKEERRDRLAGREGITITMTDNMRETDHDLLDKLEEVRHLRQNGSGNKSAFMKLR